MILTGTAFLALWNGVQPEFLDAYEDWHSREHVPERLTVPGILAAWRYRAADGQEPGFFTLYDLAGIDVLTCAPYQRLLSHPSPASADMRPRLTRLSRIVCGIERREPGRDGRFVTPLVTLPGAGTPAHGGPISCQIGAIDILAPGHPVAGGRAEPGLVFLLDGDDPAALRTAATVLSADNRLFSHIETVRPRT